MEKIKYYPEIEPYTTHCLNVGDGHKIWIQESGNSEGIPVVFVHGGPGGKSKDGHRKLFDPKKCRIIQFDQRGCGKSEYETLLKGNTTNDLVEDIERVRKYLRVESIILIGSSRGPSLMVRYAIKYPQFCLHLICISSFLGLEESLDIYKFDNILGVFYPDKKNDFKNSLQGREVFPTLREIIKKDYDQLTQDDYSLIVGWSNWEYSSIKYIKEYPVDVVVEDITPDFYKNFQILIHYFSNDLFNPLNGNKILIEGLQNISVDFIHGRYDMCSPMQLIREFSKQLPKSSLHIIENAAHRTGEPGIASKVIEILDGIPYNNNHSRYS